MPSYASAKSVVSHEPSVVIGASTQITQPIHGWSAPKQQVETRTPESKTADLIFLAPTERVDALGRIDHYQVLEVRGRGGFGIVLKAFDEKLHRIVALKVLAPHLADCPLSRKRFLREAQAAAAISNDHVVGIFAVEDGPWPYIVMEYIDGPSLEEKIANNGPLPVDEILRIGRQVATGLAAAHQQGLIHRDVKPANILLENGVARVKITDFGLARAMDDATLSQAGVIYGTPAYMAPEQADGTHVDSRADLFSLGSVLYTLCTGSRPFCGVSPLATLRNVIDHQPKPVRVERPEVPSWLESIIAKLHAKNPNGRYQSAQEVADLLTEQMGKQRPPLRPWARRVAACLTVMVVCGCLALVQRQSFVSDTHAEPKNSAIDPPYIVDPPMAVAPHDAVQARLHQERWAQRLQIPIEHVNSIGQKFVLLPPGEFIMGGDDGPEKRSQPSHSVRISQPFYCGVHEVTVGEFRAFADATGFKTHAETDPLGGKFWNPQKRTTDQRPTFNWRTPPFEQTEQHPACCITWTDADAFCRWLTKKEGKTYRLPTEAEWEYACRAGARTPYHFGAKPAPDMMHGSSLHTMPVGSFPANAFGLRDMHGNVYEWCLDTMRAYETGLVTDPRGASDKPGRVVRGGGYSSGVMSIVLTAHARGSKAEDDAYGAFGFRVILECR